MRSLPRIIAVAALALVCFGSSSGRAEATDDLLKEGNIQGALAAEAESLERQMKAQPAAGEMAQAMLVFTLQRIRAYQKMTIRKPDVPAKWAAYAGEYKRGYYTGLFNRLIIRMAIYDATGESFQAFNAGLAAGRKYAEQLEKQAIKKEKAL